MAKVENIRLAPAVTGPESALSWTAIGRHAPELLDVLASGEPAAFATDSRERIVFWNRGAAALLGRRAEEAMGRHCYEVLGGRDVFGNRFCYANCPLAAMSRSGEAPRAFEIRVPKEGNGAEPPTVHVTVVRLPGPRTDLFTLVHILSPVDEKDRVVRALERLVPPAPRGAAPAGASAVRHEEPAPAPPVGPETLTPREREILGWIAAGLQNKEIAQRLDLSLATVRNHIHNTLEKLEVHSKLEAVSLAYRNGWVESSGGAGKR
ncbi:MAG TPA: LuxR C-terminal-related transcriptional regulator [Vicinamibacteria bacterium]|nr:LuxR C-terminal-related transcriptional regulator [Vicinamibacteria bacterium]